ncbi:AlpA family phage regulatory protein [Pseudomonas sp. Ga0074129]|uniref:helix-turn-helix transcriptional regulator n=1 Tax=Pseudomonas sp. Ga0074129 TaxID=1752219 RepID=UPI0025D12E9D|nr:AlpA family phage regulatory protein [Pseudomonas sp. Ga0074129]
MSGSHFNHARRDARTHTARSTIYRYIGEGSFPKPVSLGDRCVGWVDTEVQEWILARIKERDVTAGYTARS